MVVRARTQLGCLELAKTRSKRRVKHFDRNCFTLVAMHIQKANYPLRLVGFSKQRLNHHLRRFEAIGFIEKTIRGIHQEYKLTEQGKRNIIGDDKRCLLRFHHAEMRFEVHAWGTFPKETQERLVKGFKNNPYFHRKYRGVLMRFFENSVIVFCPEVFSNDEPTAYAKITLRVMKVMQELCNRHDMRIGAPEFCRRPHVAIINNQFTESLTKWCKLKGVFPEFGDFFVDESFKGEFESSQVFKAGQFVNNVMAVPKLTEQVPRLTEQIERLEHGLLIKIEGTLRKIAMLTVAVDKIADHLSKGDPR